MVDVSLVVSTDTVGCLARRKSKMTSCVCRTRHYYERIWSKCHKS